MTRRRTRNGSARGSRNRSKRTRRRSRYRKRVMWGGAAAVAIAPAAGGAPAGGAPAGGAPARSTTPYAINATATTWPRGWGDMPKPRVRGPGAKQRRQHHWRKGPMRRWPPRYGAWDGTSWAAGGPALDPPCTRGGSSATSAEPHGYPAPSYTVRSLYTK